MIYSTRTALLATLSIGALVQASASEAQTAPSAPAAAQTAPVTSQAPTSTDTTGAADIIVTANKRAQRLRDVGITIVAADAQQLNNAGVVDVSQLPKIAPGFSVGTSTLGYQVFSLRGVNFNAAQVSAAPAVSTYIDEASLPYTAMTGALLLDVERVEVLKGPQGTLFGQNATGGSINVIAAKPTSHLTAGFDTEVNNFGQVVLDGYVSGPVSSTLRARLSGSTTQFGAWQRGYFLNNNKNGDQNKGAARLLLDWTPADRLHVAINLNASYDHGEAQQSQFSAAIPANPAGAFPGLTTYPLPTRARDADIDPGFDTHVHNRLYQSVLRADYELADNLTITSLTDYANFKSRSIRNLDGTALDIFNSGALGNVDTINQEVRLSGKAAESRLTYILGGNYQYDKIRDENTGFADHYSPLPPGSFYNNRDRLTNRAWAVFGNADFEIVPKLTLTAGARYTSTKQTIQGCTYGNNLFNAVLGAVSGAFRSGAGLGPVPAGTFTNGGCGTLNDNIINTPPRAGFPNGTPDYLPVFANYSQKQDNVSWRAGLNYKPTSDSLIYGLISRGYKSGVFPVQATLLNSQLKPVGQEQLTAYEIGTKLSLLDRKLDLNLAAFYYDYRNKQFYTYSFNGIVTTSILVNIPKSSVKGVDADVVIRPVQGLTVRGAITYVDTKVDKFTSIDFQAQPFDASGKQFNFAPPVSATFDAEYRFPVTDERKVYIGAGGQYNSRTYSDLGELKSFLIPAYTTLDARIGLESSKGWRVGAFVRNLTDKYYWTSIVPAGDTITRFAGLPRMYGVNAAFTF